MSFEREDPDVIPSDPRSASSAFPDKDTRQLFHELRELAHDHLALATLEARLSVTTLLRMVVIAIGTALVLVSAWLGLIGAAALALIGSGLAPVAAMLLVAMVNLLLAVAGWLLTRHISRWLGWPATLRSIRPASLAGGKPGDI